MMVQAHHETPDLSEKASGASESSSVYGRAVPASPPPAPPTTACRPRFQAQLFGGRASGWTVELPDLIREIAVYLDGRRMIVVDSTLADRVEGGELMGVYRLVEASGPETRYVGTAWS
jgi:hypothetical protein